MYFKPRIFISSTFDLIPIRKKINNIFVKSGAELMLYEKNLTPSTSSATYRDDIQESDFVIFIFEDRYGSKTKDSGLSGTHEEWKIANANNIPFHVYIKHNKSKNKELNDLIKELMNNNVSFYYYKDASDLLKRIQETIFTIAREIAYRRIPDIKLTEVELNKLVNQHDYDLALQIIKLVEDIKYLEIDYDICDTNVLVSLFEPVELQFKYNKQPFVDLKLNDIFSSLVGIHEKFSNRHVNLYTSTSNRVEVRLKSSGGKGEITFMTFSGQADDKDNLRDLGVKFFQEVDKFKNYIIKRKIYVDAL